jgi:O-acetylhomoserine/O-acetylserine sulfhydrylase-like pyridoxal-dependent enzyme
MNIEYIYERASNPTLKKLNFFFFMNIEYIYERFSNPTLKKLNIFSSIYIVNFKKY